MVLETLQKVQLENYVTGAQMLWYIGDLLLRKSSEQIVKMSVKDLRADINNYISEGKLSSGPVIHLDDDVD